MAAKKKKRRRRSKRQQGRPKVKKPLKKRMIRVADDQWNQAKKECGRDDRSVSSLIRELLAKWLKKKH